jgi:hypothetical protein
VVSLWNDPKLASDGERDGPDLLPHSLLGEACGISMAEGGGFWAAGSSAGSMTAVVISPSV